MNGTVEVWSPLLASLAMAASALCVCLTLLAIKRVCHNHNCTPHRCGIRLVFQTLSPDEKILFISDFQKNIVHAFVRDTLQLKASVGRTATTIATGGAAAEATAENQESKTTSPTNPDKKSRSQSRSRKRQGDKAQCSSSKVPLGVFKVPIAMACSHDSRLVDATDMQEIHLVVTAPQ